MHRTATWLLSAIALTMLCSPTWAQTARKPSFFESRQQPQTAVKTQQAALHHIRTQADFDRLARVYEQDTDYEIPHVLFVIDTQNHHRIDYINTPKFTFHDTYVKQALKNPLSHQALQDQYYSPKRRYVFGTVSWQNTQQEYVYEFWEGDKITPDLLRLTDQLVRQSFFAPIRYKTNSVWQENIGQSTGIDLVTQEFLIRQYPYLPLQKGQAQGLLKVIRTDSDWENVSSDDIVILKEVPLSMPPVAAIISERASTALSHVNVLAKNWRIPNVYLKDAERILAPMVGQHIHLQAADKQYQVSFATADAAKPNRPTLQNLPKPNTNDTQLRPLAQLRAKDSLYCGSKAANLGHIQHHLPQWQVPDGFCIPFAYYQQFMDSLGIDAAYLQKLEASFDNNNRLRREGLLSLQQRIEQAPVPEAWQKAWVAQWQQQLHEKGVFVRSSSNSEDLPKFSGAGLYSTVPNVTQEQALIRAIQHAWASVFNYSAYEARRIANLPHDSVKMSVLVQTGIDAQLSGVLVTTDPFDSQRRQVSYIAAKRGLGIRVVEGKHVAEQVLYNHRIDATQLISNASDTHALQLDAQGGVKEVALDTQQRVMSDAQIKQLAQAGQQIQKLFQTGHQDIEWAWADGQLVILQARPYFQ